MKTQLKELVCLKSIVTLALTATLCVLVLTGRYEAKDFETILAMVFTYYFSRKTNKKEEFTHE